MNDLSERLEAAQEENAALRVKVNTLIKALTEAASDVSVFGKHEDAVKYAAIAKEMNDE